MQVLARHEECYLPSHYSITNCREKMGTLTTTNRVCWCWLVQQIGKTTFQSNEMAGKGAEIRNKEKYKVKNHMNCQSTKETYGFF